METYERTNNSGWGSVPQSSPNPLGPEARYSKPPRHFPWAKVVLGSVTGLLAVALLVTSLVAIGASGKVENLRAEVATVTDNLADENARTEDLRFDLEGAKGDLEKATAKVGQQRSTIVAAQDCINGILSSMTSFFEGFYDTALFEMKSVRGKCERVQDADTSGGQDATTF